LETGTGFVLLVTALVKSVTLPITLEEKLCTPLTIPAAKVAPGKVGKEIPPFPPEGVGRLAGRPAEDEIVRP
jgi:hypothetical protein